MTKMHKNYIISQVNQNIHNRRRVLVIENDENFKIRIINYLETRNFQTAAPDSSGEKPDVILYSVDSGIYSTPELSGLLKDDVPVIILFTADTADQAKEALRNGAYFCIQKPVDDLGLFEIYIAKCITLCRRARQDKLYICHLENELRQITDENAERIRLLVRLNRRIANVLKKIRSSSGNEAFEELYPEILNDFGQHIRATGGSIYSIEEKGLRLSHTLEPKHAPDFIPFPLNERSAFGSVLESGKPILIDNIESEERMASSGWKGYNDSSFMIFPLPAPDGSVCGILSLHNKTEPPFLNDDKEIGVLLSSFYSEVNKIISTSEELHLSESRYIQMTENSDSIVFSFSAENKIFDFVNSAFMPVTGYSSDKARGRSIEDFIDLLSIGEREDYISQMEGLLSGRISGSGLEFSIRTAEGAEKRLFQRAAVISGSNGFPVSIDGIISCISDIEEAGAQFSSLIQQKELLLNEINHRVKNNMQIISSMLSLQAGLAEDEASRNSLITANNRIASMSLVHDNLYDDALMPTIDFSDYIGKLVNNLIDSSFEQQRISVSMNIENTLLDLDRAVHCGLIINETVTNAFQHAFPDGEEGEIQISLISDGTDYRISISDNGSGFNRVSTDDCAKNGLGMDIVHNLACQLGGSVEYLKGNGTTVVLTFPVQKTGYRKG